jgi:hypothetical protein
MKSVQNLKSFWPSSQNYFVLALFSSIELATFLKLFIELATFLNASTG